MSKRKDKIDRKQVRLDQLHIDTRYQRTLEPKRVTKMAANFNESQFGSLEVSYRSNGKMYIFDGMHRKLLAELMGWTSVPCNVHYGLTPQDEADLLVKLQQSRKNIRAADAFIANVFAGDPECVVINTIIEGAGFVVMDTKRDDGIRAIATVIAAYRKYGAENLRGSLHLIRELWYGEDKALDGSFVGSVTEFYSQYGHKITPAAKKNLRNNLPYWYIRKAGVEGMGGAGRVSYKVAEELRKASKLRRVAEVV